MTIEDRKLITCFLPLGVALPLAKALQAEKDIVCSHISYGRGVGKMTSLDNRRLGDQAEKQILTVVVDEKDADDIFSFIYFEANINQPHGGMIAMARADHHVPLILPDIPEEDD